MDDSTARPVAVQAAPVVAAVSLGYLLCLLYVWIADTEQTGLVGALRVGLRNGNLLSHGFTFVLLVPFVGILLSTLGSRLAARIGRPRVALLLARGSLVLSLVVFVGALLPPEWTGGN